MCVHNMYNEKSLPLGIAESGIKHQNSNPNALPFGKWWAALYVAMATITSTYEKGKQQTTKVTCMM